MSRGRIAIDLVGQRFGRWQVIRRVESLPYSRGAAWLCVCDCGAEKTVDGYRMRVGESQSCGCLSRERARESHAGKPSNNVLDLTNQRFGRLVAIERADSNALGRAKWKCVCDCGRVVSVLAGSLRSGNTRSCARMECRPRTKPRGMAMAWVTYKKYRRNAATHGRVFDITFEDFKERTQEPCAYCGGLPKTKTVRSFTNGAYVYNGLDRVDSNIGYTLDNVLTCCWVCNRWKGKMSMAEFVGHCQRVAERRSLNCIAVA